MYQSRSVKDNLISHSDNRGFEAEYEYLKKRILKEGDMPDCTASQMFEYLEQLSKFNLGKFIIANKGLSGRWTQYVVLHPQNGRLTGINDEGKQFSEMERWVLDRAPVVLATQERFFNFQKLLQASLKNKITLASVPCGAMDDLLGLNFSGVSAFNLVGIDLDADSIDYAKQNARQNNLAGNCTFFREDAWEMAQENQFDVIASNGLNIYESDANRLKELYQRFYNCLKSGGKLITSFLTPPLGSEKQSPWDVQQINKEDLLKQKVIFSYILNVRWDDCYRTEEEKVKQLESVGFKNVRVIYDRQKIFPTVICEK